MRFQLDTRMKTIKVEEQVSLSELIETLERMLPNGEWKEYKLETNTVINWFQPPVYVRRYEWPTWRPQVIYGTGSLTVGAMETLYQVERTGNEIACYSQSN